MAVISRETTERFNIIKHSSGAVEKIAIGVEKTPFVEKGNRENKEILENQLIIMAALADLYEGGLGNG